MPLIRALPKDEKNSIILKDVTATWSETTIVSTLHDINNYIGFGKLYALVGPVGAGKVTYHFYIFSYII